jgi:hypothetical protein
MEEQKLTWTDGGKSVRHYLLKLSIKEPYDLVIHLLAMHPEGSGSTV